MNRPSNTLMNANLIGTRPDRKRITSILITSILAWLAQPAPGFSGIHSLDNKSMAELADLGIHIKPWVPDEDTRVRVFLTGPLDDQEDIPPDLEFPEPDWIEVSYDWKKGGRDIPVQMTLFTSQDDKDGLGMHLAEHRKGDTAPLRLIFSLAEPEIEDCSLSILFTGSTHDDPSGEPRNLGLGEGPQGYTLSAASIVRLAKEAAATGPDQSGASLPPADEVKSISVEFIDPEGNDLKYEGVPDDWQAIRRQLVPARHDANQTGLKRVGTVKIGMMDGGTRLVELYHGDQDPAGFAAGPNPEEMEFFRGGSSAGLMRALSEALDRSIMRRYSDAIVEPKRAPAAPDANSTR